MSFVVSMALALPLLAMPVPPSAGDAPVFAVDPVTRYFHITYPVPEGAPAEVAVLCAWSEPGADAWRPAKARPLVSQTALAMATNEDWAAWTTQGRMVERNAAGLLRTLVFNPYPENPPDAPLALDFRITIQGPAGETLTTHRLHLEADNGDVVYLDDWSKVLQRDKAAAAPEPGEALWQWPAPNGAGNTLTGNAGPETPLPQLTYPLDLKGAYALFVSTPGHILLRLTGEERADDLTSREGWETLWDWKPMDRQHLVLKQRHEYTGWKVAAIRSMRLVPLPEEVVRECDTPFNGPTDKFVAGFWEPYSWAFHEDVQHPLQHRAVLTAFRDARFSLVDVQVNRFGAKAEFESRVADQLLFNTEGDPLRDETIPVTDGVGKMQQFTNTLDASVRYTRELGLECHANFGAGCAYVGSPLQGQFSKDHPDWHRGSQLKYEIPEVRQYALSLVREALEAGAPGVSIDFMRYSFTIPDAETCNLFLRELRSMTRTLAAARGKPIPILVQFPGRGVLPPEHFETGSFDLFDYATWVREGWVDFICPSNDDERHLHLDVTEYLDACEGTACKVLPNVTAAGLKRPGLYLWRVHQLYEAGVPGIYVYQSDQCVLGSPMDRRCARLLASSQDVAQWWAEDARLRPHRSKGIYITRPSRPNRGWRPRERVRIWLEGIELGRVELYLDGQRVNTFEGPPYLLGSEERTSDGVVPPGGEHELLVHAQDGAGWLEQTFILEGERRPSP